MRIEDEPIVRISKQDIMLLEILREQLKRGLISREEFKRRKQKFNLSA